MLPVLIERRSSQELGLEQNWLNDSVKGFLPGGDVDRISVFQRRALSVAAASPRFLLAMKLPAPRTERDQDDIQYLYKLCGLTTAAEGLDLLSPYYPEQLILPRVQFLLQGMFPDCENGHGMEREQIRNAQCEPHDSSSPM